MFARMFVAAAVLLSAPVWAQESRKSTLPERFTAFAVSLGGPRSQGVSTNVEITIDRWSTPQESQRLTKALTDNGADAALSVLKEMKPVGSIRTPGNLAYDLHYAAQSPTEEGGRRIFLATDRPITYWQAVSNARIVDYPFTFIEMRMDGDGEGEGKLALATKINASDDGKFIQLVSYRTEPISLNNVRHRK